MSTKTQRTMLAAFACVSISICLELPRASAQEAGEVKFVAHRIGSVRSEAICVADMNGDGRLDIVAGPQLYLAPDWKAVKIRTLSGEVDNEGKGYFDDFANMAVDVDGDGKLDIVSCGWFCKCVRWHRNALGTEGDWPEVIADVNGNYEGGDLADLDGDGKKREVLGDTQMTVWFEPGKLPSGEAGLIKHVVSEKPMAYGGGVGDVNGDGRPDILRPNAWFEAPADPRAGAWIEHAWALGAKEGAADHTTVILTYDVNGDGKADVITSSAHKYGIFWYEQVAEGEKVSWKQHTIDDTWTQAHSLALADINGDGALDLVTGKRFMAHNGGDPDEYGPLGVYWYELSRGAGSEPAWKKHVITLGEGIGSGVFLCAEDMDADGDPDVVVTGKWGGPVLFENKRK